MATETKKITDEVLKEWDACRDGYRRFCELFPEGAPLREASDGLITDGRKDWSDWLWSHCANDERFVDQTVIVVAQGTATAGNFGTATAGNFGTATAGNFGTATAGDEGTATAGDEGVLTILYWDDSAEKYRRAIAVVGENGIEPNTPYRIEKGKFVRVESEKTEAA